jgi:hypothetical protein
MMKLTSGRNPILIIIIYLLLFSCKTSEKVPETRLRPMSPGRLFRTIEDNTFDYSFFSVRRINIQIDDGESSNTFRAGMQAIRDRQILLSVTKFNIPLGRISLTPDSIVFVNYIERTYLSENYEALSNLLNFDLDFWAVQAILSGDILSFFEDDNEYRDYNSNISDGMYTLQSEKMRKLRKITEKGKSQKMERLLRRNEEEALIVNTFYFDPELFVMRRMILEDKTYSRNLVLTFSDHQKVGRKYFPGSIAMVFGSDEEKISLELKMSGFSTEYSELQPIRIPEKYDRLYLN